MEWETAGLAALACCVAFCIGWVVGMRRGSKLAYDDSLRQFRSEFPVVAAKYDAEHPGG